jgi:hypothetical protein
MNGISSTIAVSVIAIILVVAGAGIYLVQNEHSTSSFTTTYPLGTTTAVSTSTADSNSTIGINLSFSINSTITNPSQGQDLQTVVEVLNRFPMVNNVSVADDFPVMPLHSKCLPGDYTPFVVQMYQGMYDTGNISSASPLPYFLSCPARTSSSIVVEYYYLFQPSSANATLYGTTEAGNFSNTGPMSLQLVNQISIHQFSSSFPNGNFPEGVYTLMVEDWWGQIVILQIMIVS